MDEKANYSKPDLCPKVESIKTVCELGKIRGLNVLRGVKREGERQSGEKGVISYIPKALELRKAAILIV